jgi:hypothetical protein
MKIFLGTRYLSPVHVHQEQFHVLEMDILEDDNGMFAWIA